MGNLKMHQITLTGDLCSGKSTTCSILSERLGMEVFSIGKLFRKEAEEKGLTLLELHATYDGTDSDFILDKKVFDLRSVDNLIVDARLGWFFLPESFKVYLTTQPREIVKRARKSNRGSVENYSSDEEALNHLNERKRVESDRFLELYGVNLHNKDYYDCVIDTTNRTSNEVVDLILKSYEEFLESPLSYFHFNNLLPTLSLDDKDCNELESLAKYHIPVGVIKCDDYYFIKSNHLMVINSKLIDYRIPCSITAVDKLPYPNKVCDSWESVFGFKYIFKPSSI